MTFDFLSRFRKPVPTYDPRGHHHVQRPSPAMTRVHAKRPPIVQARPQVRRGHHPHAPVALPRAPAPPRKGSVMRGPVPARVMRQPARPYPPQRGSKLMNYFNVHFHPSQKRDLALPPLRSSKHMSSQQAPPFPPPRGSFKPPSRRVHWAPAQATPPPQPYPYPSHSSSRTSSSHTRVQHYQSAPHIPRYQPPQRPHQVRDLVVSHRRR